jgi:hypothetical protein
MQPPLFSFFDKVFGFIKKVTLWKNAFASDSVEMFFSMSEYLQENDYEIRGIKPQVLTHLTDLENSSKVALQTSMFTA